MDIEAKFEFLKNQVIWAITHYKIINTTGIFDILKKTVNDLDVEEDKSNASKG